MSDGNCWYREQWGWLRKELLDKGIVVVFYIEGQESPLQCGGIGAQTRGNVDASKKWRCRKAEYFRLRKYQV